jgi:hypothetical protein
MSKRGFGGVVWEREEARKRLKDIRPILVGIRK